MVYKDKLQIGQWIMLSQFDNTVYMARIIEVEPDIMVMYQDGSGPSPLGRYKEIMRLATLHDFHTYGSNPLHSSNSRRKWDKRHGSS